MSRTQLLARSAAIGFPILREVDHVFVFKNRCEIRTLFLPGNSNATISSASRTEPSQCATSSKELMHSRAKASMNTARSSQTNFAAILLCLPFRRKLGSNPEHKTTFLSTEVGARRRNARRNHEGEANVKAMRKRRAARTPMHKAINGKGLPLKQ